MRIRDFLLLISLADLQNRFVHYLIPSSDSLTHSAFIFYFLKVGQINLRFMDMTVGLVHVTFLSEIENLKIFVCVRNS